jgi:hypothetical protein
LEKTVSNLLENHEIAAQETFQWSQDAMYEPAVLARITRTLHARGTTRSRRSVAWSRKGVAEASRSYTRARALLRWGGTTQSSRHDGKGGKAAAGCR